MQLTKTDPVLNSPAPVAIHGRYYVFRELSRRQAEAYATVLQRLANDIGKRHNLKLNDLDGDRVVQLIGQDVQYLLGQFHGFLDSLIGACCLEWDGTEYKPLQNGMLEDPPYSLYLEMVTNAVLAQRAPIEAFTGGLAAIRDAFQLKVPRRRRTKEATTEADGSTRPDSSPASPSADSTSATLAG